MAPKRATRTTPAPTTATTTTVTNAQLQAMIDQVPLGACASQPGNALSAILRNTKGVRGSERVAREYSYRRDDGQSIDPRIEINELEAELWNLKVIGMSVDCPTCPWIASLASKPKTCKRAIEWPPD
ncbi:hypothetical protein Tco_0995132 [Tanacetum coccineum]